MLNFCSTYEVATACALAIKADKLICITDGQILNEQGRPIRFLTLQDADMLIRKLAKQSEIAANYVKVVGEEAIPSKCYIDSHEDGNLPWDEKGYKGRCNAMFQNGVGFDNGNGLWSGKQGFAIGGEERLSRLNGYLSELAAAAYVCRVSLSRCDYILRSVDSNFICVLCLYMLSGTFFFLSRIYKPRPLTCLKHMHHAISYMKNTCKVLMYDSYFIVALM